MQGTHTHVRISPEEALHDGRIDIPTEYISWSSVLHMFSGPAKCSSWLQLRSITAAVHIVA
jgi:hypothetical protein